MHYKVMEPTSNPGSQAPGEKLAVLLQRSLWLDLEVSHQGSILKLGAVFGGTELKHCGGMAFGRTLENLANLAQEAHCVIGHNLVRHDLPVLREVTPGHPLLRLPVIDTLILSPLAFPQNPYHRLVKDYKLVHESVNDPVVDARQAASLFGDEFGALAGLRQTEPRLFALLHFLLATSDEPNDPLALGMEMLFQALGGTMPAKPEALELCQAIFHQWAVAASRWIQPGFKLVNHALRSPMPPPGCGWPAATRSCHRGCAGLTPRPGN